MRTLQQQIRDVQELYRPRNALYLPGALDRILFLHEALLRFGKLLRNKEQDKETLARAMAGIFARTCTFADLFVDLPIVEAMCEKYPAGYCAYCGQVMCKCETKRTREITLANANPDQMTWGIRDFITDLDMKYGANNKERGLAHAFGRLIEEVHEAERVLLLDVKNTSLLPPEIRMAFAREFADVFAWICSISGPRLLDLNVEVKAEKRYSGLCNRCGFRPCKGCGPFHLYAGIPGTTLAQPTQYAETTEARATPP